MAQLNAREKALAKRVGKGGEAFVLARRKRPGMSLLEFQALNEAQLAELAPAPPGDAATTKTTAAKKAAAKKATGSPGRS